MSKKRRGGFMSQEEHLAFSVALFVGVMVALLVMLFIKNHWFKPSERPALALVLSVLPGLVSFCAIYIVALWRMGLVSFKDKTPPDDKDEK